MNNFTKTITRVMDFASTENWMDCGDYLIFGWDEYIKESGQEGLDPLKQEGLNSRSLGRALFRIKQAWVSHEVKDVFSKFDDLFGLDTESKRYCLELGTACQLVEWLPGIVRRCEHLDVLAVGVPSDSDSNRILTAYFKEATLCYLLGLNSASMLLSRSTLELALETTLLVIDSEFYWSRAQKPKEKKGKLEGYIDLAHEKGIFKTDDQKRAHKIRKLANGAAHEKPVPDEEKTKVCLEHLRELTQTLLEASW